MSWKCISAALAALAAIGGLAVTGAAADGGPSPGTVTGWDGVLARGGAVRYVALDGGGRTTVAAVRTRGGRVIRYGSIRGSFGIPVVANDGSAGGLTRNGKSLVLATYVTPGSKSTRFAVVSTKTFRLQKLVTLRGSWSFDALSPDGETMYLIEYIAAANGARYRVRAFDLAAGRLIRRPIVDRTEPGPMVGSPVTRATSADGAWAYTLYARAAGEPFIHALDTTHRVAHCLDLEWSGSAEGLWSTRLALSADGSTLMLRTRTGRTVIAIDAPRR
jgi:hypothetical protein